MECVKLGDYCDITSSKRVFANQYVEKGVPFYRSREIIEKKEMADISEPLFISEELYETFRKKFGVPIEGDLLLTSVGTLGIPYIVKNERFYFKDGNLTWMKNFKKELSSKYLYYWLNSKFGKESLINRAIGSSQAALTIAILKKYKIFLPTLINQNQIVDILSAYDNLIENNNKRIKILEQMAENLYKEWFVRFRFPNYQNTEFENGIPKGWKVIQVQDLFDISIGRTPDRKVFEYFSNNQSDYLWISIADMKDKMFVMSSAEYLTCDAIRKVNMPMVSENTVILSFKLSVGRVAITTQLSCTNEAIAHFNTNNKQLVEYTYLYLKFFQYQDLGNTSAIGNAVNSTIIRKMKFLHPDGEIVRVFHLQIKDVFNEIKLLSRKNQNLIKQRDMLLPRLMSGKLEVK